MSAATPLYMPLTPPRFSLMGVLLRHPRSRPPTAYGTEPPPRRFTLPSIRADKSNNQLSTYRTQTPRHLVLLFTFIPTSKHLFPPPILVFVIVLHPPIHLLPYRYTAQSSSPAMSIIGGQEEARKGVSGKAWTEAAVHGARSVWQRQVKGTRVVLGGAIGR